MHRHESGNPLPMSADLSRLFATGEREGTVKDADDPASCLLLAEMSIT